MSIGLSYSVADLRKPFGENSPLGLEGINFPECCKKPGNILLLEALEDFRVIACDMFSKQFKWRDSSGNLLRNAMKEFKGREFFFSFIAGFI